MPNRLFAVLAAVAAALLFAACGSSGSSSSAAASGPKATGGYGAGAYAASSSQSAAPTTSPSPTITTKQEAKLGTILAVGTKQMTVYMFKADTGTTSACTGACASVWPPVTGTAHAAGQAASADLGTIKRADGSVQVTYKGHPLYRYVRDGDAHDAYGAGIKSFGAPWYTLAASGKVIDNS